MSRILVGVVVAVLTLIMLAGFASAASASGEFEPNDAITQTAGPLSGGVNYTATQETDNDVDWYRFYIRSQVQLRITATGIDSDSYCDDVELRDRQGDYIDGVDAEEGSITYIDRTLYDPGLYYVVVSDCYTGDRYRFSLSPAAAIVENDACGGALTERGPAAKNVDAATNKIAKLKQRKANANGRGAKQRLKAKIRNARGLLATATAVLLEIDTRIAGSC